MLDNGSRMNREVQVRFYERMELQCSIPLTKAIRHGMVVSKVSEMWSTQTCSYCGLVPESAPKGISAIGVRNWKCSECDTEHDRDINAARNIFNFGAGRCALTGSLAL